MEGDIAALLISFVFDSIKTNVEKKCRKMYTLKRTAVFHVNFQCKIRFFF